MSSTTSSQLCLSYLNPQVENTSTYLSIERLLEGNLDTLKHQGYLLHSFFDPSTQKMSFQIIHEGAGEFIKISSEMIQYFLPPDSEMSGFSLQKTPFIIEIISGKHFCLHEIHITLITYATIAVIETQLHHISKLLIHAILFPHWFFSIAHCPGIDSPKLHRKIIDEFFSWAPLLRKKKIANDFLDEAYRFCIATNFEFKTMRSPRHLTRLIASHHRMKKQSIEPALHQDDRVCVRIVPSKIHFLLGWKYAVSIIICIRKLFKNEQFDHRHILEACKRVIPSLTGVPRSYYSYKYPNDPAIAFHIDCEKPSEEPLTLRELTLLKKELPKELQGSIEPVMSRMDIPSNEEELFRNMILLLEHLTSKADLPHLLIQFQSQTNKSLHFNVTIARTISPGNINESIPTISGQFCHSILIKSYIDTRVQKKYLKQGLMFLVDCPKEAFLRKDRSIDFRKARNAIVSYVKNSFGPIRDINGGLLYQQHTLLQNITPLLTGEELIHLSTLEDLFSTIFPGLMKNFINPEELLSIFRMLLKFKNEAIDPTTETIFIEETATSMQFGFTHTDALNLKELYTTAHTLNIPEQNFALFSLLIGPHTFSAMLLRTTENSHKTYCLNLIKKLLKERQTHPFQSTIKIGLPFLSTSFDPKTIFDIHSQKIIHLLYEGLLKKDSEGKIHLALAKSFTISDDGLLYKFVLKNTFWSNGTPLTAHDFVYTWRKILHPSFSNPLAFLLFPIKNAVEIKKGILSEDTLGVIAINETTLEIHLNTPNSSFLLSLCSSIFSPIPNMIDTKKPGWAFYQDPSYICNGPFLIKKRKHDKQLIVIKNDVYWNAQNINISKIEITTIENQKHGLKLYQQHRFDSLYLPFIDDHIQKHSHLACPWKMILHPIRFIAYLNTKNPLLSSYKVRKALFLASQIEKSPKNTTQEIIQKNTPLLHNIDKKKVLEVFEEGILDIKLSQKGKKKLLVRVCNFDLEKQIAETLLTTWSSFLPITFSLQVVPEIEFFDRSKETQPDIFLSSWFSTLSDPHYEQESFFDATIASNMCSYEHAEIKTLLIEKNAALSEENKKIYQRRIEELLIQEIPYFPICDYTAATAYKDSLGLFT